MVFCVFSICQRNSIPFFIVLRWLPLRIMLHVIILLDEVKLFIDANIFGFISTTINSFIISLDIKSGEEKTRIKAILANFVAERFET